MFEHELFQPTGVAAKEVLQLRPRSFDRLLRRNITQPGHSTLC
jgi:hypothetical protein